MRTRSDAQRDIRDSTGGVFYSNLENFEPGCSFTLDHHHVTYEISLMGRLNFSKVLQENKDSTFKDDKTLDRHLTQILVKTVKKWLLFSDCMFNWPFKFHLLLWYFKYINFTYHLLFHFWNLLSIFWRLALNCSKVKYFLFHHRFFLHHSKQPQAKITTSCTRSNLTEEDIF